MALNMLGMGLVFTAKDLASGTINNITHGFLGLNAATLKANASYQRSISVMGAGLAIMATGVGLLMGSFALADAAGQFEQGIAKVGAISKATSEELKLLHDAALEAGMSTQFSPTETVQGLEELAAQGFNARESIRLLNPTLALAGGGMISVASATSAVSSAVRVFGLDMDASEKVADKLLAISNSTSLAAKDMELALGTVGRGASLTNQKLEEMLISMGLVKNTGVDASVAAQSVSSALIFMAGRAEKFKALGVSVTDAQGNFRDFMDIVTETSTVLESKYTDQAERAAMATELFSRFGLQAYSAITKQLSTGIRTTAGQLLKGADAVAYLRLQMGMGGDKVEEYKERMKALGVEVPRGTEGVAEDFKNKLLDTFEGQKTLLSGNMETLAVVMGESFAKALKPVVGFVSQTVASLVEAWMGLPMEFRVILSRVALVAGVLLTAAGAFIALSAAVALLGPFLPAIVAAMGAILAAMLPIIIKLALLAAVFSAFRYAVENNIGNIGFVFLRFWESVKLVFRGLVQLFSSGGFSGAVMQELNRAENAGLKRFVIQLYQIGFRVMQFFRGVRAGFGAAMDAMGPSLGRLRDALVGLGRALGLVGKEGAGAIAGIPSARIAGIGASFGIFFGKLVEMLVWVGTATANVVTGLVEGWGYAMQLVSPLTSGLGDTFSWLGGVIMELLQSMGLVTGSALQSGGVWQWLGRVVGFLAGGAFGLLIGALKAVVLAVGGAIMVVKFLWDLLMGLGRVVLYIGALILRFFQGIGNAILNTIDLAIQGWGEIANLVPAAARPGWMESMVEAGNDAKARISSRTNAAKSFDSVLAGTNASAPAVDEARGRAEASAVQADATGRIATMVAEQKAQWDGKPINTSIFLDGQKIASAVTKVQYENKVASFQVTGMEPAT